MQLDKIVGPTVISNVRHCVHSDARSWRIVEENADVDLCTSSVIGNHGYDSYVDGNNYVNGSDNTNIMDWFTLLK